jgi:hypothetical protein
MIEQRATYTLATGLLEAKGTRSAKALSGLVGPASDLCDSLVRHLEREEELVLSQVDGLFDDHEQAALFRSIITSLPPDPRLQPWVAAALSPEHLETRLRNIAASMTEPTLSSLMAQIHDGVPSVVWLEIQARVPELARFATSRPPSSAPNR